MLTTSVDRYYWNIVKGIGIVLVVMGHACETVSNYVYLFHLPLFFFVSGYLYNEEKYGDNPYLSLSNKLKNTWSKYLFIYVILIFLHNVLYSFGMLESGAYWYSKEEMIVQIAKAFFGMGQEIMGGTLWFVPVLIEASCMLSFIVSASRKVFTICSNKLIKYGIQSIFIIGLTWIGYMLYQANITLAGNIQIALIVMPFIWGGYILHSCLKNWERFLNSIVTVVFVIILLYVNRIFTLDLAFQIVYPYMHIVAFLGIYVCLYFAKVIKRINFLKRCFDKLGEASFWIMFAHFPVMKLIDWFYVKIQCPDNVELYQRLPISFSEYGAFYLLIGIVVPMSTYVLYEKIKHLICK